MSRPNKDTSPSAKAIFFRGASVASEDGPALQVADVLVEDGVVKAVGEGVKAPGGAKVIDASGKVLMPAMFDVHAHLREPGREDQETVRTGTEAAINGGVTGLVMMPDTAPAIDSGGVVRAILDNVEENSRIRVLVAGCITRGRAGHDLSAIASLARAGVVMLTDSGNAVASPLVLRRAMEYANNFGLLIASHCDTPELSGDGAMNEGAASYSLGIPGLPAISEEIGIDRDIRIAHYAGARLHIQHVSTARGMEAVRRFKEEGLRVTCEVTPHHLLLNEDDIVDYDTRYKTSPPLRTRADNEALVQGLIDGVFDVIATGHAPHTDFEKNQDFSSAPFGMTGLETALPALHHYLVKPGRLGWDVVVKRFSAGPRRLVGLEPVAVAPGQPAELTLFNPDRETVFSREFMRSKSSNTPFLDRALAGMVEAVVYNGGLLMER